MGREFRLQKRDWRLLYGRDEDVRAYLNLPPKQRTLADFKAAVPSLQNALQPDEARSRDVVASGVVV